MKSLNTIFSFILIAAFLLGFSCSAFAQDTDDVASETIAVESDHSSMWSFSAGVGVGMTILAVPIFDFNAELMYAPFEHWRLGFANRIHIDRNFAHEETYNQMDSFLFMNEIPFFPTDIFEIAIRIGVGYDFMHYGGDYESKEYHAHGLGVDAGLSFDWSIVKGHALGFNLDYMAVFSKYKSDGEEQDFGFNNHFVAFTLNYTHSFK